MTARFPAAAGLMLTRILSLGIGLLLVLICALFVIRHQVTKASWERTDGWVHSTYVSRIDDYHTPSVRSETSIRDRYVPHIDYAFTVGGEHHRGSRIAYGIGDFATPGEAAAVLAPFRSRAQVTVYYPPGDPESAVLILGYRLWLAWIVGGIGLALICLSRFVASLEREAAAGQDDMPASEEQAV